ncbi:hypothetical protein MHK_007469 [Candidatus Magnetomorum sp. HK-1]|nr:hypothetical protein MHK_007469 [Candidatus Magnetomorum sp. HK-1]
MIKTKTLGNTKNVAFDNYIEYVFNNCIPGSVNNENANKILEFVIASESKVLVKKVMKYNDKQKYTGANKTKIKKLEIFITIK